MVRQYLRQHLAGTIASRLIEHSVVYVEGADGDADLARLVRGILVPMDGDADADAVRPTDELPNLDLTIGHERTFSSALTIRQLAGILARTFVHASFREEALVVLYLKPAPPGGSTVTIHFVLPISKLYDRVLQMSSNYLLAVGAERSSPGSILVCMSSCPRT